MARMVLEVADESKNISMYCDDALYIKIDLTLHL